MISFDLAQLEGGLTCFEYPLQGGGVLKIYAHHPTAEEIAVAYKKAGVSADSEQKTDWEFIAKQAMASVDLACFCIESIEGADQKVTRTTVPLPDDFGLTSLDGQSKEMFPRVILKDIGMKLLGQSRPSEEQNFHSEQPPSGPA